MNIRTLFSQTIGTAPLSYIFTASDSNSAVEGETACNTFALRGSIKQLINYNSVLVQQPPVESDDLCIQAIKSDCCDPIDIVVPKEVCAGVVQEFCVIDTCLNNDYTWNFGDGTPNQTGTCITHTYTTPGVYSVTIRWETACGANEKKYEITVKECPCEVNAFANITSNGLSITADASGSTSTYPMLLYVWDFGDGTYGTGITATHNYALAGTYDVTLTVYTLDNNGRFVIALGDAVPVWK